MPRQNHVKSVNVKRKWNVNSLVLIKHKIFCTFSCRRSLFIYLFILFFLERFSIWCRKTKTKKSPLLITKGTDTTMNQSEFEVAGHYRVLVQNHSYENLFLRQVNFH